MRALFTAVALAAFALPAQAEPISPNALRQLSAEALERSQVMERARYLTDRIGPRLTASPSEEVAARWAASWFRDLGLSGVTVDPFPFGQGWSTAGASLSVAGLGARPLRAIPEAWTPGTKGVRVGETVVLAAASVSDLQTWRGRLRGRVVLASSPVAPSYGVVAERRLTADDLKALREPAKGDPDSWKAPFLEFFAYREALDAFAAEEGALAVLWPSDHSGGVINVTGYTHHVGFARRLPHLVVAREDYNAVARATQSGAPPRLSLRVDARFHPERRVGHNVLADLGGRTDEIIMVGAHLDSWHAGTGATDNAAGVAIVMEAARILKAMRVTPRRTIRFALWSGEEQGMLGAQAYVDRRLAAPIPPVSAEQGRLPLYMRRDQPRPPLTGPEARRLRAYFNVDAGSGRVRGLYGGPSPGRREALQPWAAPLKALGVEVVSPQPMPESDDWPFRHVGVPAFGFIQDPLDYHSRTHHTDLDVQDYLREEDLRQAAAVVAAVVLQAANAEEVPQ